LDTTGTFPMTWVTKNLPGSFLKYGQAGHAFQTNYERYRAAQSAPAIYSLPHGRPIRARAELSGETCWVSGNSHGGKPICSPAQKQPWGFYSMTNFVATTHLDFWNVQPEAASHILNDTSWAPMWRLLNRYAGVRWARQSPGAWIAFRDGLDAMDTERFSTEEFGELKLKKNWWQDGGYPQVASSGSQARAEAICKNHSALGCQIEVPDALTGGPMEQRHAGGINDVAFGNWRGDYGGFVRLIEPLANSQGWWRVGSEEEKFGRFARGFMNPRDPDAVLPLTLDHGLWGGLPLQGAKRLALRVLFFDKGAGKFDVNYDSKSGKKNVIRVQKRDSGSWHEVCAVIDDAHFGGRGPQKADIWFENTDSENDIFGALEIADADLSSIALNGCDWQHEETSILH